MSIARTSALLVLVAACGGHGSTAGPDASAGADAGPKGTVTVTALDTALDRKPVTGASIVFDDVDGTVTEVTTDANGQASASVAAGASVTAVYPQAAGIRQLESVLDVAPGDALEIAPINDPDQTTSVGSVSVTLPTTTDVFLYGPCGSIVVAANSPTTVPLYPGCTADPITLVAVQHDAGGNLLSYVADVVPFTDGAAVTMPSDWQPFASTSVTVSNLPAGNSSIDAWSFSPNWFGVGPGTVATVTPAAPTFTMKTASLAGTKLVQLIDGEQIYDQVVPGDATSYALDAGAVEMPAPLTTTYDVAARRFALTFTGGRASDVDAFNVGVIVVRSGGALQQIQWSVWGGTAGDVMLPALPADLQDLVPLATDTIATTLSDAIHVDGHGYEASRAHLFALVGAAVYGTGGLMSAPLVMAGGGEIF